MRTRRRRGSGGIAPVKLKCFWSRSWNAATSKNTTKKSTMATISSSNYWTAMAIETTFPFQEPKPQYFYDDCGVKCRITPGDETDWQPCEPWCTSCGYPPRVCDSYFTKCTGTKVGEWLNEETGKWIEADAPNAEEQEDERWNQYKFGLCPICNIGLDDRSDFTFNYSNGSENGVMMCFDCDEKLNAL